MTEKRYVGKMPLGTKSWQRPQPEYTLAGKSVMPIAALGGCILKLFFCNKHTRTISFVLANYLQPFTP
jgi:hypothetical protein